MPSGVTQPIVAVVDDDESVRDALSSLLRSLGFAVAVFASAGEVLAWPGLGATGCLIADVRMPDIDGLELQRQLQARPRAAPMIFITAHADPEAEQRARAAGAVAFLRKPFEEPALVEAVRTALAAGGPREAGR